MRSCEDISGSFNIDSHSHGTSFSCFHIHSEDVLPGLCGLPKFRKYIFTVPINKFYGVILLLWLRILPGYYRHNKHRNFDQIVWLFGDRSLDCYSNDIFLSSLSVHRNIRNTWLNDIYRILTAFPGPECCIYCTISVFSWILRLY